jgi:hypothetical protein
MQLLTKVLSVVVLSIGFALQPAPGMSSAPQAASTTTTTCKDVVLVGSSCTITYTVTLIPAPENDPCYPIGKVKISGTVTCPGSSCGFEDTQCRNASDPVKFMCESLNFELRDPGTGVAGSDSWGDVATGKTKCSDTTATKV